MAKAVSPVVATVLLLALTVLAFSMIWEGVSSWISAQRGGMLQSIRERFVVEDVWFRVENGDRALVTVYIRNVGLTDIEIDDISLNGTTMDMWVNGVQVDSVTIKVDAGVSIDLRADGWSWQPGAVYQMIIVTRGGVSTVVCKP
ncbi:hypothetical protein J7L70_01290 [Candidatus Bathyarchaeota archaeon]|nr:hypothetical protein [Candidatus Bathyarchaeota archaeon]